MGIPGLFRYVFGQHCKNSNMVPTLGTKKIQVLFEGNELIFHVAKMHPPTVRVLVDIMRWSINAILERVAEANPGSTVYGFLAFNGVLPTARLWQRRERAHAVAEEKPDEFPEWFKPYEVAAGTRLMNFVLSQMGRNAHWNMPMRVSGPYVEGEVDAKMASVVGDFAEGTGIVFIGAGAELFLLAMRTAANCPTGGPVLMGLLGTPNYRHRTGILRRLKFFDMAAMGTTLAESHGDTFDADDGGFARDFSLISVMIGGGGILPRFQGVDMDAAMKAYAKMRAERGGRLVHVVDDSRRWVMVPAAMAAFFSNLVAADEKYLPPSLRWESPIDYMKMVEWTLKSMSGAGTASFSWNPAYLGKRFAPAPSLLAEDLIDWNASPADAEHLERGHASTPREQMAVVIPPKFFERYFPKAVASELQYWRRECAPTTAGLDAPATSTGFLKRHRPGSDYLIAGSWRAKNT